jgi:hypothetical protein
MEQNYYTSPSSSNTTYILSGELKKRQSKNNKDDAILYMDITSRVICIQNNNVSSVASGPKPVIQKLKDDNGNTAFHAVISSQESDDKEEVGLAHLSKLKVVKKNGKDMLRMTASANKFDASGKYAQNSINLNNIPEGETTITLLSESKPLNLNLIQEYIDATLVRTRLFASLTFCVGINYFNFPGVENRGQRWFLLGRKAVDGVIVAVDINGRCNAQSDNTYFMYRSDLNIIQFKTSELRTILTNPVNFNPPLSEEEYNRWVRNHGNVTFGLSSYS